MRRQGHTEEGGRDFRLDKIVACEDRSRQVLEGEEGCSDCETVWVQKLCLF